MSPKPIIFLDLDGVCANFIKAFQFVCRKYGAPLDATAPDCYDLSKLSGWDWPRIEKIIAEEENFWLNIEALPWALDLVTLCRRRSSELFILSTPWIDADSRRQKTAWVTRSLGLPADRVILTKHKHLLAREGRVLIDDCFLNCGQWAIEGGYAITFPAHHNGIETNDPVAYVASRLDLVGQIQKEGEKIREVAKSN